MGHGGGGGLGGRGPTYRCASVGSSLAKSGSLREKKPFLTFDTVNGPYISEKLAAYFCMKMRILLRGNFQNAGGHGVVLGPKRIAQRTRTKRLKAALAI